MTSDGLDRAVATDKPVRIETCPSCCQNRDHDNPYGLCKGCYFNPEIVKEYRTGKKTKVEGNFTNLELESNVQLKSKYEAAIALDYVIPFEAMDDKSKWEIMKNGITYQHNQKPSNDIWGNGINGLLLDADIPVVSQSVTYYDNLRQFGDYWDTSMPKRIETSEPIPIVMTKDAQTMAAEQKCLIQSNSYTEHEAKMLGEQLCKQQPIDPDTDKRIWGAKKSAYTKSVHQMAEERAAWYAQQQERVKMPDIAEMAKDIFAIKKMLQNLYTLAGLAFPPELK